MADEARPLHVGQRITLPSQWLGGVVILVLVASTVIRFATDGITVDSAGDAVAWIAFALFLTAFAVRFIFVGVVLETDDLVIRNPFRTRRVQWRNIKEISSPSNRDLLRTVNVLTSSGETIRVHGIATAPINGARVEKALDAMRRLLRERRDQASAPSSAASPL